MKAEEEQEAAARFLSPSVSLAAGMVERGRGREGGCAAGHCGDSLSLLSGVCTHKLCFRWPRAERRRTAVTTTLRLFLPHAVIYQEEPEEARGGVGVGGLLRDLALRGPLQRHPNANLWIWDGIMAPSRNLRSCWSR